MKHFLLVTILSLCVPFGARAGLPAFEASAEWEQQLRDRAPATAPAVPAKNRQVLVFSLATGYQHWCIPHTETMVRVLGEKSGAYTVTASKDIEVFRRENLARYDAVVLNNTCPERKERDAFRDVLINKLDRFGANYRDLPLEEREALAKKLYRNLADYIAGGGGLVLLHGGITCFNYSDEFSAIAGGSFAFHPPQQDVTLLPVEPAHPLLKPFGGQSLTHHDEPYIYERAYAEMNFRPLLAFDVAALTKPDRRLDPLPKLPRYVAWIKRHQAGRVFNCSPSHNAQSFDHPALLAFILGGIQYAVGDLDCPDEPIRSTGKKPAGQ